jgi:hypothetical protein
VAIRDPGLRLTRPRHVILTPGYDVSPLRGVPAHTGLSFNQPIHELRHLRRHLSWTFPIAMRAIELGSPRWGYAGQRETVSQAVGLG